MSVWSLKSLLDRLPWLKRTTTRTFVRTPVVLQIEALAQVGAILALREFEDRDNKIPFFTGIDNARFRRPVVPGDTLRLEVTALRIGSKVQKMHGVASVDGHITAEAEILSIIANRPIVK